MSIQAVAWVLEVESTTSGADRLVLLAIANHASPNPETGEWEAWPAKDTIGREANIRRDETIREALARLEAAGLIERVVNGAPDRRHRVGRSPNLYRLFGPPVAGSNTLPGKRGPSPESGATPPRKAGTPPSPESGDRTVSNNHQEPSNLTLVAPSTDDGDQSGAFEVFWRAYPRKTAKGEARKAWPAAVGKVNAQVIIDAATRFRDDPNREDPFTPHPATWLRGERWGDPPLPSRATRGSSTTSPKVSEDRDRPNERLYL